ncbi:hypothetical protein Tco_0375093 [Tanacetum coccineum]
MCRQSSIRVLQQMEKKYVTNHEFHDFKERVDRRVLNDVVPPKGLERILEENLEKMVDGDDDSEATEFDGSEYLNDKEDSGTRLEPGRHKEISEEVDDDDDDMEEKKDDKKDDDDDDGNDDDDHTDHASIKDQVSGSQQLRIEKMQTPIPSPPRSFRIDLCSDKDITLELMGIEVFKGCAGIKKKKGKRVDGEASSSRPSLKVRFRQQPTSIPPPSYDKERDEIHEATLLSLTMHKTAKATEDQENVAIVLERILKEDIEKMVDDDDDSEATEFDGSEYFNDEEDSGTRHQGIMMQQMEKKYVTNHEFHDIKERVDKVLSMMLFRPRDSKKGKRVIGRVVIILPGTLPLKERILEENLEKMVDGDDDSEATEFDGYEYLNDKEDSGTRLEPGRHKEISEEVDDDDDDMEEKKDDKKDDDDDDGNDDDDHTDHASIKDQVSGSQQLRIEKMQTPIPSPPRSFRIDLCSDKDITLELMCIVSPIPITS